uniref:Uncharacterized protein MANES_10G084800 n=1 Tax=Rhizophora mucronata TaxID=61149 RepID=A0A2P2QZW5_RHIMU
MCSKLMTMSLSRPSAQDGYDGSGSRIQRPPGGGGAGRFGSSLRASRPPPPGNGQWSPAEATPEPRLLSCGPLRWWAGWPPCPGGLGVSSWWSWMTDAASAVGKMISFWRCR